MQAAFLQVSLRGMSVKGSDKTADCLIKKVTFRCIHFCNSTAVNCNIRKPRRFVQNKAAWLMFPIKIPSCGCPVPLETETMLKNQLMYKTEEQTAGLLLSNTRLLFYPRCKCLCCHQQSLNSYSSYPVFTLYAQLLE